jgi:hypothetical protein
MVIQVRSVPESQEWEVIVEPSTEASRPTRMLVQESNSSGVSLWAEDPGKPGRKDRARTAKPRIKNDRDLDFLIAHLLKARL